MNSSPIRTLEPDSVQRAAASHASEILEERRERYLRSLRVVRTKMEKWRCAGEAHLIDLEVATASAADVLEDNADQAASPGESGFGELDSLRRRYHADVKLVRDHLRIVQSRNAVPARRPKPAARRNFFTIFTSFATR